MRPSIVRSVSCCDHFAEQLFWRGKNTFIITKRLLNKVIRYGVAVAGLCLFWPLTWWRHQMETFSTLLVLCAGNSPVTGEFASQRQVTWSFHVFFYMRLNTRLSKQPSGWWLETPPCSLWRHCQGCAAGCRGWWWSTPRNSAWRARVVVSVITNHSNHQHIMANIFINLLPTCPRKCSCHYLD